MFQNIYFYKSSKKKRKKFTNYFQIHLKSEMKTLKIRNNKHLQQSKNVVEKILYLGTYKLI